MWELVIINVLSLIIGLLSGIMIGDKSSKNMQIDNLRKEQRELEREIKKIRRMADDNS